MKKFLRTIYEKETGIIILNDCSHVYDFYFTVIKKYNKKVISIIYKDQLLNIKVNKAGINGGPTFFAILKM